jgi:hypothetical protein
VKVDGCSSWEEEGADSLEQAGAEQLADGSFYSVALLELILAGEELADQLVVGQALGVEGEDEVQGCALVPAVFGLGAKFEICAMRLGMHGLPFCAGLRILGRLGAVVACSETR